MPKTTLRERFDIAFLKALGRDDGFSEERDEIFAFLQSEITKVREEEVMLFMQELQDRANTVRPNLLLNEIVNYAYERRDRIRSKSDNDK